MSVRGRSARSQREWQTCHQNRALAGGALDVQYTPECGEASLESSQAETAAQAGPVALEAAGSKPRPSSLTSRITWSPT